MDSRSMLGVLGGMGPAATAQFFKRVVELTKASCDQEHIPMVIYNYTTIMDRSYAVKNGKEDEFKSELIAASKKLVSFGATCIAIPCNGASSYIPEIQDNIPVPYINMIHESILECVKKGSKKVGILGTEATVKRKSYSKALELVGIEPVVPSQELQNQLMDLIYNKIKAGKTLSLSDLDPFFEYMIHNGCDTVLLACTELSLYTSLFKMPYFCIDAMDQLVLESIHQCGTISIYESDKKTY